MWSTHVVKSKFREDANSSLLAVVSESLACGACPQCSCWSNSFQSHRPRVTLSHLCKNESWVDHSLLWILEGYWTSCVSPFSAKQWKRMVTKATFVGPGFTRKPPKYERFIRPSGLWFNKAHVTHPELKCTFNLEIIGVKKNPNGQMYTSLGVLTKGTVIEVRLW